MDNGGQTGLVTLLILLAFGGYSLFSKAVSRSVVTLPMLFAVLGLVLSRPIRSALDPATISEGTRLLAEGTLILVLFSDASHVRFRQLLVSWFIPVRMLLIGMPLTIGLGTLIMYFISPGAGFASALLIAALLTPTDAALGQAAISNPLVPLRLRQSLNVESGLNDGLALPFVLSSAFLASGSVAVTTPEGMLGAALSQIVLAVLVGVAVGGISARAMDLAQDRGLMEPALGGVAFLCSAVTAYALAELVGGNGFIATFLAGMIFGNSYRSDITFIGEFMQGAGSLLTMAAFLVLGALLLPDGLAHAHAETVLVAVLFLTVIRILPICLSLAGTGLGWRDRLFLGWFGPRGLATILFTLLVVEKYALPGEQELIASVSMTVALSILLHGVTAMPLARIMGRRHR